MLRLPASPAWTVAVASPVISLPLRSFKSRFHTEATAILLKCTPPAAPVRWACSCGGDGAFWGAGSDAILRAQLGVGDKDTKTKGCVMKGDHRGPAGGGAEPRQRPQGRRAVQSLLFPGLRSWWIGYQRLSHLFKKRITQPRDRASPWGPAVTAAQGRLMYSWAHWRRVCPDQRRRRSGGYARRLSGDAASHERPHRPLPHITLLAQQNQAVSRGPDVAQRGGQRRLPPPESVQISVRVWGKQELRLTLATGCAFPLRHLGDLAAHWENLTYSQAPRRRCRGAQATPGRARRT